MSAIKLAVLSTGTGMDALTQKEGAAGLTVQFESDVQPVFLSWRSLRQILSWKSAGSKPEVKPPLATQPVSNGAGAVK